MNYLSVCSGIEAATVAWHPLGWTAVAYSEVEPFPCAVLAHHFPGVPNWGDMTNFKEWSDATINLLVGGTPCQSFSVAGLRKGLDDPRGDLMLVYLAIVAKYRPEWLVWENVPGVLSSNKGRDFAAFLRGLAELGYGFAYRTLDAQYFGVAQRRRRVFVVGCDRGWQRAAAVLFERSSLSWDFAKSGGEGKGYTFSTARCVEVSVFERHDQDSRVKPVNVAPALHSKADNLCDLPIVLERPRESFCPQCGGEGAWLNDDCDYCQGGGVVPVNSVSRVRRITPTEAERLQGFPDGYTHIPWRGKETPPDGPRYKALGNSFAVPVVAWIGSRIQAVSEIVQ